MCHAAIMPGKGINFIFINVNRMGKPDILPYPIYLFHVFHRAVTKLLTAKSFFIFGFCQVGMQMKPVMPGQLG